MNEKFDAKGFAELSPEESEELRNQVLGSTDDPTAKELFEKAVPKNGKIEEKPPRPEAEKPNADPFDEWREPSERSPQNAPREMSSATSTVQSVLNFLVRLLRRSRTVLSKPSIQSVLYLLLALAAGLFIGWLLISDPSPIII